MTEGLRDDSANKQSMLRDLVTKGLGIFLNQTKTGLQQNLVDFFEAGDLSTWVDTVNGSVFPNQTYRVHKYNVTNFLAD